MEPARHQRVYGFDSQVGASLVLAMPAPGQDGAHCLQYLLSAKHPRQIATSRQGFDGVFRLIKRDTQAGKQVPDRKSRAELGPVECQWGGKAGLKGRRRGAPVARVWRP